MASAAATIERQQPGEPEQESDRNERLRAAVGRLARRLRPTQAGAGLTPSQISVLFTIVRRGPIGLTEVAELESLNPTMLSRVTSQLAEQGLIRRSADPRDRRAALVEATAAGTRMRTRIQRERTRALAAQVERLPAADRELLWEALPALERLVELMRERS